MLIVGAKGFATEVLEVLHQLKTLDNLVFYDDVNSDVPEKLYDQFPVLKSYDEARAYFKEKDDKFTIGIGNPILRKQLFEKFSSFGGQFTATLSPKAEIGLYNVQVGNGSNVLANAIISNGTKMGLGCLIYFGTIIAHDVELGDFVEVSPGSVLLGRCKVGSYSQIGSNSTILPDVTIGAKVIVAAGAVVTKNIPDSCMVAGVPAVIKKYL